MSTRRQFLHNTMQMGMAAAFTPLAGPVLHSAAETAIQSVLPKSAGKRPNILLLFPDQWRFDWVSANSHLPIRTPNLDRLAEAGTRFTNMVVASPLCAPSRACLASGRIYGRTGVASNGYDYPAARIKTFYSMLRDGGYHVLGCGKMDLAKASDWWGIDGKWRLSPLGFSDGINNAGKIDQVIGYELNNDRPADPYLTFLNQRGLLPGAPPGFAEPDAGRVRRNLPHASSGRCLLRQLARPATVWLFWTRRRKTNHGFYR